MGAGGELELLPYGYSILDYARRYDAEWIAWLEALREHILALQPQAPSSRSRRPLRSSPVELPDEVVSVIITYLDHRDLLRSAQVSRAWCALSNDAQLWTRLLMHDYSIALQALRPAGATYSAQIPSHFQERPAKLVYLQMARTYRALLDWYATCKAR